MATTVADIASLLEGIPSGAWVAISERQNMVMAFGVDAQVVLNRSHEKGEDHPLILRVPDQAASLFL